MTTMPGRYAESDRVGDPESLREAVTCIADDITCDAPGARISGAQQYRGFPGGFECLKSTGRKAPATAQGPASQTEATQLARTPCPSRVRLQVATTSSGRPCSPNEPPNDPFRIRQRALACWRYGDQMPADRNPEGKPPPLVS